MVLRLERGSKYQEVWREAVWLLAWYSAKRSQCLQKVNIIKAILCTRHCARNLGHLSEQMSTNLYPHGTYVLVRKIFHGWGLAKARRSTGSWETQIMSVFPDGLRCGAGAELIIVIHKTRAKLIARVTCHWVTEERPGIVTFWSKVTFVQTSSTCLSLQMGIQCLHLDADTWL